MKIRYALPRFKQWILRIVRQHFDIQPCYKCGTWNKTTYESQHPYCHEGIMMKHYQCKKCGHMDAM